MTAVIAAMQKEADVLLSAAEIKEEKTIYGRRAWRGSFAGTPFLLVLSGIGKSNAASAAMLCIALGADRLLNIGVAGGLTPKAPVGSVLQMERAAESDFDLSKINGTPVGTPNERDTPYFPLKSRKNAFVKGTLASADSFSDGSDAAVLAALGADVRDMEGAAIAHAACAADVPVWAFKAISDNAGEKSIREYSENLQIALAALGEKLPNIFAEVNNG